MVSKQTVVKATLSVVFILSWGHYASAMYDPMLGRFASRDPIAVVQRLTLYENEFRTADVDPSGEIKIDIKRGSEKLACPATPPAARSMDFLLSKKAECDGYLVQQVCVTCEKKDCPCPRKFVFTKEKETYCYLEATKVAKDTASGIVVATDKINVGADFADSKESCASYRQKTLIKFFCDSVTGDLSKDWTAGSTPYGEKTSCVTSGGPLSIEWSMNPGKQREIAPWFDEGNHEQEPAESRSVQFNWCCCGNGSDKFEVEVGATP